MKTFIATLATALVQATKYESLMAHMAEENAKIADRYNKNPYNGTGDAVQIEIDGVQVTKYIATMDWGNCSTTGSQIYCPGPSSRAYIMDSPSYDSNNPQYYEANLLGGSVEWDADLSQHECGCINTFYTVSMPAKDWNGNYSGGDPFHYCDANGVGGDWCPEFDLMEANKYAFQTTPHHCDGPNDKGHYSSCDTGGSAHNSVDQALSFGPGQTIDTNRPIHVKVEVTVDGSGSANQVITTISQDGNQQQMINSDAGYLSQMNDALTAQVFVISNWQGDAGWLWKNKCSGSCWNSPGETISNIKIKSGSGKPQPGPKPDPSKKWKFGDNCKSASDCKESTCSQSQCKWSWPADASWDSPDADCRCDV